MAAGQVSPSDGTETLPAKCVVRIAPLFSTCPNPLTTTILFILIYYVMLLIIILRKQIEMHLLCKAFKTQGKFKSFGKFRRLQATFATPSSRQELSEAATRLVGGGVSGHASAGCRLAQISTNVATF